MAAIENLELIVDADISSAVANLEKLQEELQDIIDNIETVDRRGDEGIDIASRVDGVENELARVESELEAFEVGEALEVDFDIDGAVKEFSELESMIKTFEATHDVDVGTDIKKPLMGPGFQTLGAPQAASPSELSAGMSWLFDDDGGRDLDFSDIFRRLRRSTSKLRDRFDDFDIRMSDLHNLLAKMVPLLVVFIGTIPALATAFVGLAAAAIAAASALVALAGFGALGVGLEGGEFQMDNLTDVLEEVRDDFIEAFAPLAERLEPLFRDAIDGLDFFFQAVADQGDALMELTDEARAFGRFMTDWIPGVLRSVAAMAEAFAPVFADFADWLDEANILRDFTELTMEALPAIKNMISIILDMLPALVRMSIGFTIVANAILKVLGFVGKLLSMLGISPEVFGLVTGSLLAMATAIFILNSSFIKLAVKGLALATISMYQFWLSVLTAEKSLLAMAASAIVSAISSIYSLVTALFTGSSALGVFTISAYQAAAAAAALLTILTLGVAAATIVPMAMSAAAAFTGMSDSIQGATSSLKEFDRVAGRTEGNFNPYGGNNPPAGGGAAANGSRGARTVINIESSNDRHENRSNARYATFRQGRTTGSEN